MVIPVGPPGAQHVVKAVKSRARTAHHGGALRHLRRRDHPLRAVHRLASLVKGSSQLPPATASLQPNAESFAFVRAVAVPLMTSVFLPAEAVLPRQQFPLDEGPQR